MSHEDFLRSLARMVGVSDTDRAAEVLLFLAGITSGP